MAVLQGGRGPFNFLMGQAVRGQSPEFNRKGFPSNERVRTTNRVLCVGSAWTRMAFVFRRKQPKNGSHEGTSLLGNSP